MSYYGYIRVSTNTQVVKGQRLDTQKNAIIDYCKKNNIELSSIFEDAGISGTIPDRDGLNDLMSVLTKNDKQAISNMIKNDFYTGIVTHDGKKYQGEHEPIITQELFDKVNQ